MSEKKKIRSRVLKLFNTKKNRTTGEDLNFNENVILAGLAKRKEGSRWAYIVHDKDVYVEGTIYQKEQFVGDKRPRHWHVLLNLIAKPNLIR